MLVERLNALRSENDSEAGFTLIELMIVVVIIGILAAVAIPVFLNQQKGAIAAGVKSDVKNTVTNISTALVKTPTAAKIGGTTAAPVTVTKSSLNFAVGATTATANTKAVVSDSRTILIISGTWQGYTVVGVNNGLTGNYTFDSTTGLYEGTDDIG